MHNPYNLTAHQTRSVHTESMDLGSEIQMQICRVWLRVNIVHERLTIISDQVIMISNHKNTD